MDTSSKGALLERKIINTFVEEDPENRIGLRGRASKSKGKAEVDIILIDKIKGEIIIGQAKNLKQDLGERARENIIKNLKKFEGNYKITAKFFGKEYLHDTRMG